MNAAQSKHLPGSRFANRGILGSLAGPALRWIAALVLVSANLPLLLAGVLTAFNSNGEHELLVGFGDNQMEITLHHRQEVANPGSPLHSHTILEKILIGESVSGNEPDHRFSFARHQLLAEEDDQIPQQLSDSIDFDSAGEAIPVFVPVPRTTASVVRPQLDAGDLPPPLLMLRGIVMRI